MLSYSECHMRAVHWLYWNARDMVVKKHHCHVKVVSSSHVASERINDFKHKKVVNNGDQETDSIISVRVG